MKFMTVHMDYIKSGIKGAVGRGRGKRLKDGGGRLGIRRVAEVRSVEKALSARGGRLGIGLVAEGARERMSRASGEGRRGSTNLFRNFNGTVVPIVIFLGCFLLSFVASSAIIQPQASRAVTGLGLVGTATMTIASNSGTVSLTPNPTANSGMASISHTLTANTNVPTGYNLAISTPSTPALTTTSGTITSPTTLANNTWGYALARTSAVGVTNNFDTSYAAPTPSLTSKWANPSTSVIIKNTSARATNDVTTVYYGVKVNMTKAAGTYNNTVRYTATANITNIAMPTIASVTPATGTTAGGTAITIVGTGFTVNNQSITTAVTIGGTACTGISISSDTPSTGRDTIYCNTPVKATAGATNVVVTTWKGTVTSTNAYTYVAPTSTITKPTASQIFAAGTASTTLTVTTNYAAICYYGTATNPTTAMTTTGDTTHTQSITGLTNASTNVRYVRCQAATGHSYGNNASVTFYVKAATPAVPTLTPANSASVNTGTTAITVASSGATCKWGTSSGSYPNASGATRATTVGTNTLYYSCVASSGSTVSDARTGSWSYTGVTPAVPPAGSNPSNIRSTNPAVLDVYPTTGWAGDNITISSNALFTNVTAVTIGGTACTTYTIVSTSIIACTLPSKTAGTSNAVAVTNGGNNVTLQSTYTHMEVTYFNPSASTVSIGGTIYPFYPNGFTGTNCANMPASNAAIASTPANSMAYIRDTRNNQTYRVKKMADNKCWMVDNLKYIDTTIANIDGTAGMVFNNGDHLNNGGITAYNTVNEFSTQSTANSDKAFYNNLMSSSYCYGTTDMPTNSLTRCGYQYNWYAATNGTGTYAQSTSGTNVTGNICPVNFRLPSGMSNGSTATSNGTSYAAADFAGLNASMNSGSLTAGSTSNYNAGWQPAGAWGGTFSGYWGSGLGNQGSNGYFWSSTVYSADDARGLYFFDGGVGPGFYTFP